MMSFLTYITGFFYELWTFADFDRLCKLEKRGDEIKKKSSPLKILSQSQPNFWEFPIGSYVKLSSAVAAILVGVLKWRTQFWKRTTQESFQQSLVEIGSVFSEEKIKLCLAVWPCDQFFFFTCNFEVNLITHLGVLALFSSNL
jgi:hypothetical protein